MLDSPLSQQDLFPLYSRMPARLLMAMMVLVEEPIREAIWLAVNSVSASRYLILAICSSVIFFPCVPGMHFSFRDSAAEGENVS